MTERRPLEQIIAPPAHHMVGDGFRVNGFLPSQMIPPERMNPFLMMDYMSAHVFPPSEVPKGVPPHPHRGLETVTLIYKGEISYHDNAGNSGTIRDGDVQWMTSGKGILHKEYHGAEFTKKGGTLHGVQLWVNLLAKDKMTLPKYQDLPHSAMGKVLIKNDGGEVNVIAGSYQDVDGPAETFSPVHIYDIRFNEGAEIAIDLPAEFNTCALVVEGEAEISNHVVPENHLALFDNKPGQIFMKGLTAGKILLLSGEDLNEPIAAHGPFVMNTQSEIRQAFNDYHRGEFGALHGW